VMVREVTGRQLSDLAVAAPNYFVFFGASVIVALFILRIL